MMRFATAMVLSVCSACSEPSAPKSAAGAAADPATAPPVFVVLDTTAGRIVLELDSQRAPISVANFLLHADRGDYNGTVFHRVIPTFVIQGGGWTPDLKERAKADEAAGRKDAPIHNEWQNGLKNSRGTIAMARDAGPDTATREFYINVADNPKLDTARPQVGDAGYAVFGHVVRGMDVVDAIKDAATTDRPDVLSDGEGLKNVPVRPVMIKSVQRQSPG